MICTCVGYMLRMMSKRRYEREKSLKLEEP